MVDSANPSTLYVGAWKDSDGGGLWISHDAGRTLAGSPLFKGQPIHALVQAPSDPAHSLCRHAARVFRSKDGGATLDPDQPARQPRDSRDRVAGDRSQNPDIVYAGTWHLPWKTTDGGKTWHNIKQGVIVDSDVFSIIVDPEHPHTFT